MYRAARVIPSGFFIFPRYRYMVIIVVAISSIGQYRFRVIGSKVICLAIAISPMFPVEKNIRLPMMFPTAMLSLFFLTGSTTSSTSSNDIISPTNVMPNIVPFRLKMVIIFLVPLTASSDPITIPITKMVDRPR